MKHFTISCDDTMYDWLQKHPEINKSGLFQKVAEYMMNNSKTSLNPGDIKKAVGDSADFPT
jgi:hypothetical protein